MKKYLSLILVALCSLCLFTGCVESDIGVKLNADESGSISATIGIEEETYEQFAAMGATMFDGKETTTYEHDGKTYVAYTEVKEYESFDDIEKALLEMTYSTDELAELESSDEEISPILESPIFKSVEIEKTSGLFYTVYSFNATLNPQTEAEESEDVAIDIPLDEAFRMTFSVEMPKAITESNGGTVEDNKVTFEIDDVTEAAEFSVMSEQLNIAAIVVIVLALLIVAVAFVLFMKRRSND